MSTFTRLQVAQINEISKYQSTCCGVWYTKPTNQWGVRFRPNKEINVQLGFFDTETEAIKVYTNYHEKFYIEILKQIKKKRDEE
jgi:hypothetical protein